MVDGVEAVDGIVRLLLGKRDALRHAHRGGEDLVGGPTVVGGHGCLLVEVDQPAVLIHELHRQAAAVDITGMVIAPRGEIGVEPYFVFAQVLRRLGPAGPDHAVPAVGYGLMAVPRAKGVHFRAQSAAHLFERGSTAGKGMLAEIVPLLPERKFPGRFYFRMVLHHEIRGIRHLEPVRGCDGVHQVLARHTVAIAVDEGRRVRGFRKVPEAGQGLGKRRHPLQNAHQHVLLQVGLG